MEKLLKSALENRYSTKKFAANSQVDEEKVRAIIDTLHVSPSSLNCQPWHVFVISNQQEKERLAECAWDANKGKYTAASHLFVFCRKSSFGDEDLENAIQLNDDIRQETTPQERKSMMANYLAAMDETQKAEWMNKQIYLMLGQFVTSCALLELQACIVGGFKTSEMDELLGLKEKGLASVITAVIGVGEEDDFNAISVAPKVRFDQSQVITEIA